MEPIEGTIASNEEIRTLRATLPNTGSNKFKLERELTQMLIDCLWAEEVIKFTKNRDQATAELRVVVKI